jgi:Mn2+/Fe2+ NRAMP family transporter
VFFIACIFYVSYLISGFLAGPDWGQALQGSLKPNTQWDSSTLYMIVGIVGTTIAPWMQFYQQASVVEKGIPLKHYRYSQWDTIAGAIVVTIVCYFIMLACAATLHRNGIQITDAGDAAMALKPVAGRYCAGLFAFGLMSASLFGAAILPISTATSICEAMGWERGVNRKFTEAPHYYSLYTIVLFAGAAVALAASKAMLIPIMIFSQVVNGILLPVIIFFMLRITSDKSIMGAHTNSRWFNIVAWAGAIITASISILMVVMTLIQ